MSLTLAQIAEYINGSVIGDANYSVSSVGTLSNADSSQLSFLSNPKYKKFLNQSRAGAIIVLKGMAQYVTTNAIEVDDPYVAYAKAASQLHPTEKKLPGIHPSASIDPSAKIGANVCIGANVVIEQAVIIEDDVVIGPGCVIEHDVIIRKAANLRPNVTLCFGVMIGERTIIHPGVVIGADGFGIANDNGHWIKVPQVGSVNIGNDVEIGANTTIDRGAIDDTVIADGVKLDNQIQIGHNVTIGKHSVIAGCTGIAGSTSIGEYCAIGGGTGMAGHINIASGVQLTGMSMVTKSINEAGIYSSGIPVEPAKQWHKNVIRYRQMDKLFDRVKQLEEKTKD
ncbi:UDP-3-O-acylglucosamine N-acyltransferase [Methylophaga thalassica]|uniref:UDP-3-O-acylglucosamine N-acyltransferase n=1 Tax=Methylophaga thalassica TaxID=40223 RepID=A0ABQ5TTY1_9GAMM|nr:UDP-3-O-(3-hydroxymyristoyl)glucosamine N-acyltransferase [Methylophaga thalassica]GLP98300.1 UDP-3-O-acylglucosamine N-acyltransferase [Methylophaga thalassica]